MSDFTESLECSSAIYGSKCCTTNCVSAGVHLVKDASLLCVQA